MNMEQSDKDELLNVIIKNKELADEVVTDFENLNPDIHEEFVAFRHKILELIDSDFEEKEEERDLNAPTPRAVQPPTHATAQPVHPPYQQPSQQPFHPPFQQPSHPPSQPVDRMALSSSDRSDLPKPQPAPQPRQLPADDSVDRQLEDMNRLINQRQPREEPSSLLNKSHSLHQRVVSASHDSIDFDVPRERSERVGAESLDSGKPRRLEAVGQRLADREDSPGQHAPIKIVEEFPGPSPQDSLFKRGYGLDPQPRPAPEAASQPRRVLSNHSDDYADFQVPEEKSHASHTPLAHLHHSLDRDRLALLEAEEDAPALLPARSPPEPRSLPLASLDRPPASQARFGPGQAATAPGSDFGKFFEENAARHKMSRIEEAPFEHEDLSEKAQASLSGLKASKPDPEEPLGHAGPAHARPPGLQAELSSQSQLSQPSRGKADASNPRSQQLLPLLSSEPRADSARPAQKLRDRSLLLHFEPPQPDDADQPFQYQPDFFLGPPKQPAGLLHSEQPSPPLDSSPEREVQDRQPRRLATHLKHPSVPTPNPKPQTLASTGPNPEPQSRPVLDSVAIEQALQPRLREVEGKYQLLETEVAKLHAEFAQAKRERESLVAHKSPSVLGRAGDSGYFPGPNSGGPSQHPDLLTFQPRQDSASASHRLNQLQLDPRLSVPAKVATVSAPDTHHNEFEEKYKKETEEKAALLKEIGLLRLLNQQHLARPGQSSSSGQRSLIEREPFVARVSEDDTVAKIREFAQGKVAVAKMDLLLDSEGVLSESEDTLLELRLERNLAVRDNRFYLKGKLLVTNKRAQPLLGFLPQVADSADRSIRSPDFRLLAKPQLQETDLAPLQTAVYSILVCPKVAADARLPCISFKYM